MNGWINAKTQLPDKDGRYLACYGSSFIAKYNKLTNEWTREDSTSGLKQIVSHWMPIPKCPSPNES